MAKAKNQQAPEVNERVENEKVENSVEQNKDVVGSSNADANNQESAGGGKTEKAVEKDKVEYLTLAEAYEGMLKGGVFRFKEWDKRKIGFVAFVPRGMTTIMLAVSETHNTRTPYRPSQEEAIKKLWYQVK